ncbi:MAG: VWA domain-containing protein [Pseudomonadota bacterium]
MPVKRPFHAVRKRTGAFAADRGGNIIILFSFMFAAVMLFSGGALDFSRYNTLQADLAEALDAAGLAMAQYDDVGGPEIDDLQGAQREAALKSFGEAVFRENFQSADVVENLQLYFDITPQRIRPRATGQLKTLLLRHGEKLLDPQGAGGLEYLDFDTTVEVTRRGSGRVELALVLDVTGSMDGYAGGKRKIDSLKDAVDNLLQVMFGEEENSEFVKVGLVPFNAHVNPGGATTWQSSWSDENAEAHYHGARFIHVNEDGDADGDGDTDVDVDNAFNNNEFQNGMARVVEVDRKVNHFDLYNSMSNAEWMGCVEARPFPLDELDTTPGATLSTQQITEAYASLSALEEPNGRMRQAFDRAPNPVLSVFDLTQATNSRWVPMFLPDEPECPQGGDVCRDDWGWHTSTYVLGDVTRTLRTRGYMFDNADGDGHDDDAYNNRNFVDDYDYTHRNALGEHFERYAEVVIGFRYVTNRSFGQLNNYWDGVKERYEALGIDDFGIDEYKLRIAYPGWWDESEGRYRGKYDDQLDVDIDDDISDTDSFMLGPNQDCPAPILPLTSNRKDVEDHMATLYPNGNTNSANGAVWGWRVISPEAPFSEGVDYSDHQWQKAVVIMTDGENVASDDNTHWDSVATAYGFAIEERMGDGVDRPARGGSGFDSDRMADHYDEKLLRICRRMKQQDILVYTIVFGLNNTSLEEVFRTCATSPNAPYYYKAPSGDELEEAFGDIAADLVKLHISQ